MNSLSLIPPVLLIVFGLALVVRSLTLLSDMLWSIKEQSGLYPPLRALMYGLVGTCMALFILAGGGLVALFRSIVQW